MTDDATPPRPPLRTRICDLFGVRHPIVQTGMGWVSTPELTAATSNAGGLGILASSTLSAQEMQHAVARLSELTAEPFGVNMRGDVPDIQQRADILARAGGRVASFALAPNERVIRQLKDAGLTIVPSVGALRHAVKVAALGADAVLVQGAEGGGHTGSVPTSILVPQIAAEVDIPVIAAGGMRDGRGLVAALALGADGIAMGTRFLLTSDSPVPAVVKQRYLDSTVNDTIVTSLLDGVPQRVLRTKAAERLISGSPLGRAVRSARQAAGFRMLTGTSWRDMIREGLAMKTSRGLSWSQVLMAANTPMQLKASMVDGRLDIGILATGQVAGVIDDLPSCADLIARIMAEAEAVLDHLASAREGQAPPVRLP
jgi:NAD(P)H-dependent flavin oxidoreductase YrpB (nitropropane dioxygenase family)